jgi:hypothetical protein
MVTVYFIGMRGWGIGRSLAPRRRIGDFGIGMLGANGIIGTGFDAATARAWISRWRR